MSFLSNSRCALIAVSLAAVGCVEEQPEAIDLPADISTQEVGENTGTSVVDPALCSMVCGHIYDECRTALRDSSRQIITAATCNRRCRAGSFAGAEQCLLTATCSSSAFSRCFTSRDGGAGDASSALDSATTRPDASASSDVLTPPEDAAAGWIAFEDEVLRLVNEQRAVGGTCGANTFRPSQPLRVNVLLRNAARGHAYDMATRNYYGHMSIDGRTPDQRVLAAGYRYYLVGENIAAGQPTAAEVVRGWMNSPGHCSNILKAEYRDIGIAYAFSSTATYQHYWVQNFGALF